MSTSSEKDNSEKAGSGSSFLHIQNLPWYDCRVDIKRYFERLSISIKNGGILIRDNEAFVALEDPFDMTIALLQQDVALHNSTIKLSVVSKSELHKMLMRKVRRKLDFGPLAGVPAKSQVVQRKIRPTPVSKGRKRQASSSLTFLPEEINLPSPQSAVDAGRFHRTIKRIIFRTRKVHPTRVSDSTDGDNFGIFHPEKCYEVQKIKLNLRAVCTLQT